MDYRRRSHSVYYEVNFPNLIIIFFSSNFLIQLIKYYRRCVLIHLKNNTEKFHVLVVMLQKLFRVVQGHSLIENPDSIMFQELLLGGHLYLKVEKFVFELFKFNFYFFFYLLFYVLLTDSQREVTKLAVRY